MRGGRWTTNTGILCMSSVPHSPATSPVWRQEVDMLAPQGHRHLTFSEVGDWITRGDLLFVWCFRWCISSYKHWYMEFLFHLFLNRTVNESQCYSTCKKNVCWHTCTQVQSLLPRSCTLAQSQHGLLTSCPAGALFEGPCKWISFN